MQSVSRIATTQAPNVLGTTTSVLRSATLRSAAKPFVRNFTASARSAPPVTPGRVGAYTGTTTHRRSMSTNTGAGWRPTGGLPPSTSSRAGTTRNSSTSSRAGSTGVSSTSSRAGSTSVSNTPSRTRSASTSSTPSRGTPAPQGPGVIATLSTAINAIASFLGLSSAQPAVSPERARQINDYLPDQGHLPPARQRSPVDSYLGYETSARKIGNDIGVPATLANQFPPETELGMTMYQQAPTEGGSVDDSHAPHPFNGRDFNQALRGDTPLTPGAGRSRETPDTPKERLIAGLELRVLGVPTPAGKPEVYTRTLATNAHNAELIRRLNANEAVTDGGVISVTKNLSGPPPSMHLVSVDNAFVNPHRGATNDMALSEKEYMAVGQVLVKIGEHNGVPVVAAYSDKAVLANAVADIGRHFTFEGDTLSTALDTTARGERADTAKARIEREPDVLLAQVKAHLSAPQPPTAQLITPPTPTL